MRALLASINCQKTEIEKNLEKHERLIIKADELNCDIVVFPEMSLSGYLDPAIHSKFELSLDSTPVNRLIELSSAYSVDVLFGIVEHNRSSGPFISQVHTRNGSIAGIYRKRNLADNEGLFSPGTEPYIGELGDSSFGVAVCADYSVSTEFVAASNAGALVVFHPSAPGLYGDRKTDDASWQSGFDWWRTSCIERHGRRAKELGIHIAVCTQAGATFDEDFPGWSALFGPGGEILAELPDWREAYLVVDL
ncbi:carbon-nitrogen hydrolase family protein [Dehalococcoides mccartyi]|nr:carbon-nitrogen hydrolase family protein [Dehalococcoides mccartyi]